MDFLQQYGFLIATMIQQGLLGLSLYAPLMAGQLSLASPGFYALGGYLAAVMLTNPAFEGWRSALGYGIYPLTWILAALACGLLGVVVGVPALRLRGIYLALATIALVEILRVLALNLSITGGAVGLFGIPQAFGFVDRWQYLWLFLPLLILTLLFFRQLSKSRTGRAFRAIREDELAADAMGVPPTRYKVLAFVIGAVLAGIVGSMSAPFLNTWNAKQGTFDASIAYLAYVLIGGSRSMWGPLVGGALLSALPELLRSLADWRLVINGLVLVVASLYLPQGIVGSLSPKPKPPKRPTPPPVSEGPSGPPYTSETL
ncbi:branched-chain amino acid ABC transporter permease [Deinococcus irradiatisoli]|uniref:Branched-chain amino acid ABC transporter permease n=1 Tax=Deinococcus irradiatisoli TaxID=2202254 RepID=A0A2Z3JT45_9DEIO|nr:branched-chain amino acid ABC transporter permease [Deinococcus irradiatisoli]AWN23844.1 branched-chain amino acid ABC transporter permease [Deinococcus irradiatisoli]